MITETGARWREEEGDGDSNVGGQEAAPEAVGAGRLHLAPALPGGGARQGAGLAHGRLGADAGPAGRQDVAGGDQS